MRSDRSRRIALVALAFATFGCLISLTVPGHGSAYELSLVRTSPDTIGVGELASFDVFIDNTTPGTIGSQLAAFSIALGFDPAGFAYRSDLSSLNDNYALYAPLSGKAGASGGWLTPVIGGEPMHTYWFPTGPCCRYPAPELFPGSGSPRVAVQFEHARLREEPGLVHDLGTSPNEYLGTIAFEAAQPGAWAFDWGFGSDGTFFNQLAAGPDIQDQISTPGSVIVTVIPEPGTAALLGVGLVVLARSRLRRRSQP